jgi:hypothetical protein
MRTVYVDTMLQGQRACACTLAFGSAMSPAIATFVTRMQVTAQDSGAGIPGGPHFSLHQVGLKPSTDQNRRLQPQALLTTADECPPAAARTQLRGLGIPFKQYSKPAGAKTGVVGTLGSGEPRFLLRSDIDALPITVTRCRTVTACMVASCSFDTA